MSEMMTVGRLKEILEGFEDDLEIMAVHQPNWPLVENIKGVHQRGLDECDDECGHVAGNHDKEQGCSDCDCVWYPDPNDKSAPLLLVVEGCPYDVHPYGPKEAFDDYIR